MSSIYIKSQLLSFSVSARHNSALSYFARLFVNCEKVVVRFVKGLVGENSPVFYNVFYYISSTTKMVNLKSNPFWLYKTPIVLDRAYTHKP